MGTTAKKLTRAEVFKLYEDVLKEAASEGCSWCGMKEMPCPHTLARYALRKGRHFRARPKAGSR